MFKLRAFLRFLTVLLIVLLSVTLSITLSNADPLPVPTPAAPVSIWQPAPGTTWQWQLTGTINTAWDVQMYDLDLFETPEATITTLHDDGRIVICYLSAGSYENWRPDAADFPAEVLGNDLDGWFDERWLDIRQIELLSPIMTARLDLAVTKGCDGIEPDNVDGYNNDSGFPLTYADQITYNTWLAEQAHSRNLSIGLKNDLDQIPDLVDDFDWALNEQCFQYDECDTLLPFIDAGKAVFGVEYHVDPPAYCPQALSMGFSWLTKSIFLEDEPPNPCTPDIGYPDVPQLTFPAAGSTVNFYAPAFTWTGGKTIIFKLTVTDALGRKLIKIRYPADGGCTASRVLDCSYDSLGWIVLINGVYHWKVVAISNYGKAKSTLTTFTIDFPGTPQIISPNNGATVSLTPTITWDEVAAATDYRVIFKRLSDGVKLKETWVASEVACSGGTCSFTPESSLTPGSYKLWVQARSSEMPVSKSSSPKITVQITE